MSNFSKSKTFQDTNVSAILDLIYGTITAQFPEVEIHEVMCLTGRAAAILQGAEETECKNVVLLLNDSDMYGFIQQSLPKKIDHSGCIKFVERTLFQFPGLYLEIWYQEGPINIIATQGVYVQHIDDINPILL
ncbi:hypothetical protein [Flavobacterium rhizosphaerae]|uniref:Uncharacterized protein n=1 Tax=Flavobacterium rhizosphaerae TaxID=3163298 RepID=A0ABW8YWS7_9FLAO